MPCFFSRTKKLLYFFTVTLMQSPLPPLPLLHLLQPSIGILNSSSSRVVKSWGVYILRSVNLHLIYFCTWWILNKFMFYYFIYSKVNLGLGENKKTKKQKQKQKQIRLMNLHPVLFSQWIILTKLFWKWDELMVNLHPTILMKRWTEMKTLGG